MQEERQESGQPMLIYLVFPAGWITTSFKTSFLKVNSPAISPKRLAPFNYSQWFTEMCIEETGFNSL